MDDDVRHLNFSLFCLSNARGSLGDDFLSYFHAGVFCLAIIGWRSLAVISRSFFSLVQGLAFLVIDWLAEKHSGHVVSKRKELNQTIASFHIWLSDASVDLDFSLRKLTHAHQLSAKKRIRRHRIQFTNWVGIWVVRNNWDRESKRRQERYVQSFHCINYWHIYRNCHRELDWIEKKIEEKLKLNWGGNLRQLIRREKMFLIIVIWENNGERGVCWVL